MSLSVENNMCHSPQTGSSTTDMYMQRYNTMIESCYMYVESRVLPSPKLKRDIHGVNLVKLSTYYYFSIIKCFNLTKEADMKSTCNTCDAHH